jgi:hypothetical protein
MSASLNQNWLSPKIPQKNNAHLLRPIGLVFHPSSLRSNELVWPCPRISRLAPGPVS